jgi:hypothetical protein
VSRQVAARDIVKGQRVLVTCAAASLCGDVAKVSQSGGVVYIWISKGTGIIRGAADVALNHGDPVTVLGEAPEPPALQRFLVIATETVDHTYALPVEAATAEEARALVDKHLNGDNGIGGAAVTDWPGAYHRTDEWVSDEIDDVEPDPTTTVQEG